VNRIAGTDKRMEMQFLRQSKQFVSWVNFDHTQARHDDKVVEAVKIGRETPNSLIRLVLAFWWYEKRNSPHSIGIDLRQIVAWQKPPANYCGADSY